MISGRGGRRILHVDLDAFFASVEQLDKPEIRGLPVIVGASPGKRGVVSTCSYEARAFGIRSAMPISEAAHRCPEAIFLPVRMARYAQMSRRVMTIFEEFTPDVACVSIDEAFLDLTGTERLWGSSAEAAALLKKRVRLETGLGISIGAASNCYIAKIASGLKKPDGLVIVESGNEEAFMLSLPLSKLWGAGAKTQARFAELGIRTTAELWAMSLSRLESLFGKSGGAFLKCAVHGGEGAMGSEENELGDGGAPRARSMSSETTFEHDVRDRETLEAVLMELVDGLAYRLWDEGLRSRTVALKLRLDDFTTFTRRYSRPESYTEARAAIDDAKMLLERAWDGHTPIRLIGFGFHELRTGEAEQGELFAQSDERRRKAEEALFSIEKRGLGTMRRARLIARPSRRS